MGEGGGRWMVEAYMSKSWEESLEGFLFGWLVGCVLLLLLLLTSSVPRTHPYIHVNWFLSHYSILISNQCVK